jgi:ZIP family zinc transporter
VTLGLVAVVSLVALSVLGVGAGRLKLVGIAWVAFVSMAAAAALGARSREGTVSPEALVWGYGLASGAMVTGAAVFLVPQAVTQHVQYGGFGVALGLLVGYAGHTIGHRLAHVELPVDRTAAELTAHSFAAGTIIGVIYANMPALGPTLGLAIVSHKGPAGYAAASRLAGRDRDWTILLLPSAGVGIAALAASAVSLPAAAPVRGAVFGFAAGVFLHVAMDFLPRCEIGSEIHDLIAADGEAHALLDRLRVQAVASTAVGGLAVFAAWLVVG